MAAFVILFFMMVFFADRITHRLLEIIKSLIYGSVSIMVIFAFFYKYQPSFSQDRKLGRVMQYVGKRTLDIYMIHYFLLPFRLDMMGQSDARYLSPAIPRFGDKLERKEIVNFAISRFDMASMMDKASVKKDNVRYAFNSMGRSFFLLDDGSFINIKIKKSENDPVQYSSVSKSLPTLGGKGCKARPLKSAVVPNGCVVELFDKVVLYQNNAAIVLEESPSYNIRTYMGSKNYRDIVTVTKEDAVSFHSVEVFDTIKATKLFPHMTA